MPEAVVVHFTSFEDDNEVQNHIKLVHGAEFDPPSATFARRHLGFAVRKSDFAEFLPQLRTVMNGRRIELKLSVLSLPRPQSCSGGSDTGASTSGDLSISYMTADLCADIASHWKEIPDELRANIERTFTVCKDGEHISVNL
jgi:hypothetical protein